MAKFGLFKFKKIALELELNHLEVGHKRILV